MIVTGPLTANRLAPDARLAIWRQNSFRIAPGSTSVASAACIAHVINRFHDRPPGKTTVREAILVWLAHNTYETSESACCYVVEHTMSASGSDRTFAANYLTPLTLSGNHGPANGGGNCCVSSCHCLTRPFSSSVRARHGAFHKPVGKRPPPPFWRRVRHPNRPFRPAPATACGTLASGDTRSVAHPIRDDGA